MLQKSLQNTSVLFLRMNFQLQTYSVFQNFQKAVVMNVMKMFLTTLKVCLQVFLFKKRFIIILQRIYVRKEIEPFCKKSIFKKLPIKLTKECVFSVIDGLIKQIDSCLPYGRSHLYSFFRYLCF